jgi:hypothetical protein
VASHTRISGVDTQYDQYGRAYDSHFSPKQCLRDQINHRVEESRAYLCDSGVALYHQGG